MLRLPQHAGTLTIRNLYLRGLEEGIYASDPGNNGLNGEGGEVRIENCYARNNNVQQYRIGSDNSYVKDSVAHVDDVPVAADNGGTYARGIWAKEGGSPLTVDNCDVLLEHDQAGNCLHEDDDTECATVDVTDSQLDACCGADGVYYTNCGTINKTNVGSSPDVSVPSGVPTTAEGAANGPQNDKGGGGSSSDQLEIVAASGASDVTYTFDVYGNVSKNLSNGDNSAEDGTADTITDNGDGTYTVDGITGNGYGDTYDYDGSLGNWSSDHAETDYTLSVNGSEIQPSDIGGGGSSATVVDDFEDGNLSEYGFDRGSSGASVVSSPTHSGSHALEYAGTNTEAISTSGLNAYPSAGDTVSFWVRGSGGAAKTNLSYGVQDHTNRYFVRVNISADNLALYRLEGGSSTELAADWSTPALSQDAWYELEVQWATDGTHTLTLLDSSGSQLTQVSTTDTTWSSGGVGFDAYLGSGESAYFNDVTIE
ncbi:hypothetical protein M0R88_14245 [Halorussus gelatinilyticus]|uniref:Uncharacterized protein n=1 Tax=Halorussus gelatinilyticus TaxID=2937524 RepID=A0A8U0IFK5_9EURY|nr:hypothetical protein [Halorussus gelatinilyticus]UPV99667.1 hypothetical protein M0R88_14245 [Halorussus gelatinilyticus]